MAESPQHPLQIMENQTRFDLNAAMENWRHELAAQPPLAPDNRRELETHLRDALAELKARGLNDEESFWLARRRVGPPQKLAEEFVKADPAKVWRERFYWMAVALVGSYVFMTWKDLLATWLNQNNYGWVESLYLIPVIFSTEMERCSWILSLRMPRILLSAAFLHPPSKSVRCAPSPKKIFSTPTAETEVTQVE